MDEVRVACKGVEVRRLIGEFERQQDHAENNDSEKNGAQANNDSENNDM